MWRFLFFPLVVLAAPVFAAAPVVFEVVPGESHIRYETTQDGAKVAGEFPAFTAVIAFHPDALAKSKAEVVIDMTRLTTEYDKARDMIATDDWLATKSFPKAVFVAQSFTARGDKRYEAQGMLTLKNISVPVVLAFTLDEFSDSAAKITGEATLKRTDFNVGWADTTSVADAVKVLVTLKATAKK